MRCTRRIKGGQRRLGKTRRRSGGAKRARRAGAGGYSQPTSELVIAHTAAKLQNVLFNGLVGEGKFEETWCAYLGDLDKAVSIVKVRQLPAEISAGEDEIIVVGPGCRTYYIINPFLDYKVELAQSFKKHGLTPDSFQPIRSGKQLPPTPVIMAAIGSVSAI